MYLSLHFVFVVAYGPDEHPEHLIEGLGKVVDQYLVLDTVRKIGVDQEPDHAGGLHEKVHLSVSVHSGVVDGVGHRFVHEADLEELKELWLQELLSTLGLSGDLYQHIKQQLHVILDRLQKAVSIEVLAEMPHVFRCLLDATKID